MQASCRKILILGAILVLLITGCDSADERLARLATDHSRQQAEQNRQMAKLQEEITTGARELVAADAQSRQELIGLQKDLQTERSEIGRQRDSLETDRKEIAAQRRSDPIIAAALLNVELGIACILPLALCWYLLRGSSDNDADQIISALLIEDLVSADPVLLPPLSGLRLGFDAELPEGSPTTDEPASPQVT